MKELGIGRVFKLSCLFFVLLVGTLLAGCSDGGGEADVQNEQQDKYGTEKMQAKEIADVFLAGEYERLYNQLSKDFQKEVSLKQLEQIGEEFNQGVNAFTLQSEIPLDEDVIRFVWTDESDTKGMIAVVDKQDTVHGLQVQPLETYPETDKLFTENVFALPFHDEWFVFWGGTNRFVNYHYEYKNQRYAYDFIVMKGDFSYDGDPAKNESYYAFGKEVVAPADGEVVQVESEIKDNEPVGKMNEKDPAGNHVIIDHGNKEYSLLAHFKHQSIEVRKGDQVKQGDYLGLTGNSGNSSEPHIHFHVADAPDLESSKSTRIKFEDNQNWIQGNQAKGK